MPTNANGLRKRANKQVFDSKPRFDRGFFFFRIHFGKSLFHSSIRATGAIQAALLSDRKYKTVFGNNDLPRKTEIG
jgi:hypothetical protein